MSCEEELATTKEEASLSTSPSVRFAHSGFVRDNEVGK
jgi:hypothetical protein